MKLVDKTLYHWYSEVYKNYKSKSVQISLDFNFYKSIAIDIDFIRKYDNIGMVSIDFLGLFIFHLYKDENCDHAGLTFQLNILGLDFEYNNRDVRHWDDDFRNFEYCDIEELNKKYYERTK